MRRPGSRARPLARPLARQRARSLARGLGRAAAAQPPIPARRALAAPVRTRLAAWLDYRNATWPASANPHLLINRRTAPRLVPGGHAFPWRDSAVRPRALREDRILHEIHATGGDVRRVCDLFGLSVEGATRYLATLEHPDLREGPSDRSR